MMVDDNFKTSGHLLALTPQDREFAAEHLNEIESERAERIQEIRSWIRECQDLHAPTDDFHILRFLRGCKFNIEATKAKLRKHYELKSLSPEWFTNQDPYLPEVQELLNLGVFLPLKQVDDEGRMVIVIRPCIHDPKKHEFSDLVKTGMMVVDLAFRDHVSSSIHGIVCIQDMKGVQVGHALQLTAPAIKRLVNIWQGYPNRLRSIDYVNAPAYVNLILNIFRQFMGYKLKQRVHVHRGDAEVVLLDKLPARILPPELGGTDMDYAALTKYWKQQVEENKDWLAENEQYKLKINPDK